RRTPTATPFPYTPLFRSKQQRHGQRRSDSRQDADGGAERDAKERPEQIDRRERQGKAVEKPAERLHSRAALRECRPGARGRGLRSEEHTSELQSRENLVC